MRKDLGVPLYVAAGYCDLGSGYLNLTHSDYKAVDVKEREIPLVSFTLI